MGNRKQVRVNAALGFTEELHAKLACSNIFGELQICEEYQYCLLSQIIFFYVPSSIGSF